MAEGMPGIDVDAGVKATAAASYVVGVAPVTGPATPAAEPSSGHGSPGPGDPARSEPKPALVARSKNPVKVTLGLVALVLAIPVAPVGLTMGIVVLSRRKKPGNELIYAWSAICLGAMTMMFGCGWLGFILIDSAIS